ncbi:cardiolipin synthase [Roseibium alexandrii]|uniref:Cardiolipin synthase n=1 Tax=Roseibium alexandrii TaxID=388408 RepID=A0A0M7ASG2_9HYPH|nr:cardiolipin synthase [Roseibium alexandrii]CTQ76733.1 putative cardiolipin synthase YwiE [Roseibium alexandrii]
MWVGFLAISLVLLETLAFYFSWRAIKSARTPQGSVGWVVFLISAPYVAVPVYLFLGHHKYAGYLTARRDSLTIRQDIDTWGARNAPEPDQVNPTYKVFEQIAELPIVGGNGVDLLIDGKETFPALFDAIDQAAHYILIQYYIVNDDELGRELKDHLIAAVGRGVTVRMMIDGVGCIKLPTKFIEELQSGGVQIIDPKTVRGPKTRFQLNLRNHRKTVVIDGTIGFTGGLNVGNEYKGLDPKFGPWRDTHARFTGPIVSQLQLVFAEDWSFLTSENLIGHLNWETNHALDNMAALLVPTGPGDKLDTGSMMFLSAIVAAKRRVWIASPYFVPDTVILAALKQAALRGVEVKILVPDFADHQIPWHAAFAYFDEVIEVGCEIWRYKEGFMHQKVVLVDDDLAAIGTANMDNRSFRLNFETMVLLFHKKAAHQIQEMLQADFLKSYRLETPLAQQSHKIRIGAPIARLFSPLL